ncbi:MAG: cytochrome c peroxidase [Pseudomonadota bacterium]
MRVLGLSLVLCIMMVVAAFAYDDDARASSVPPQASTLEDLGRTLFHDVNLSANRTQSCATCHDPATAFADPRGMASTGDDGVSLGDRNAPTASYAALVPPFHRDEDGNWVGGQFRDGRATGLAEQAAGPPLAAGEMGMPDKPAILARLKEDPYYVETFAALFSGDILQDAGAAYDAMTAAIAAYERTDVFSPFDSKYDRFLRGEAELTREEELGRVLFFSQQFTNCNICHQLAASAIDPREPFTNHEYHNVGTPENVALRDLNGVPHGTIDEGLAGNPAVGGDPAQRGKFRTPTLRNVAVTAPYMSNGVFADLRTVVLFYNIYNTRSEARLINPETAAPFGPPPVPETLSMEELTHGPALDDQRIDAIVAFLKTLTDARYEHLLEGE